MTTLSIGTNDLEEILALAFHENDEKRFIPVSSVHVSGVNYYNIGDVGFDFLRSLYESGLKFITKATINPGCSDLIDVEWQGCDPNLVRKQMEVVKIFENMGAIVSLSCAPYFDVNIPQRGDHLAWAESSAVLYANSVIGAWTNKESGISALASGILGKTAYVGVHKKEGRLPELVISYEGSISNEVEAGALGFAIGRIVEDKIFRLKSQVVFNRTNLRHFLAALGTSSSTPMTYIDRITPTEGCEVLAREEISISRDEVQRVIDRMSSDKEPEAYVVGCPHLSHDELSNLIKCSLSHEGLPIYAFTSRSTPNLQFAHGHNNLKIIKDSCVLWCGLKSMRYKTVATNSVKAAYYLKNVFGLDVKLVSLSRA